MVRHERSGDTHGQPSPDEAPLLAIIDDASVRSAERLVPFLGFGVRTFASAKEFLDVRHGVDVRKVYPAS